MCELMGAPSVGFVGDLVFKSAGCELLWAMGAMVFGSKGAVVTSGGATSGDPFTKSGVSGWRAE